MKTEKTVLFSDENQLKNPCDNQSFMIEYNTNLQKDIVIKHTTCRKCNEKTNQQK